MAKPELGIKRICLSCGAKFYDLLSNPIVCPACSETFDPEAATKLKRGRGAPANDDAKKKAKEAEAAESSDDDDDDDVDDDDDDTMLEDTSDLDEDDAVPPVVKPVDDD